MAQFIHLSVDVHLGCFHVGAFIDHVAMALLSGESNSLFPSAPTLSHALSLFLLSNK